MQHTASAKSILLTIAGSLLPKQSCCSWRQGTLQPSFICHGSSAISKMGFQVTIIVVVVHVIYSWSFWMPLLISRFFWYISWRIALKTWIWLWAGNFCLTFVSISSVFNFSVKSYEHIGTVMQFYSTWNTSVPRIQFLSVRDFSPKFPTLTPYIFETHRLTQTGWHRYLLAYVLCICDAKSLM